MNLALVSLLVIALASCALAAPATRPTKVSPRNPIMPGADPHAMVHVNAVWIYPTWGSRRDDQRFFAFSSADLSRWQRHGPILSFKDVAWIGDDGRDVHFAWAPCAVERGGRFYFYYSVGPQNPTPSRIGVAVADRPEGPFKDSGRPLLTGASGRFEAIDPMVYVDPKDDVAYLYAGGSNGAKLRAFELNADMVSFKNEVEVATPPQFTEGAFVHEHAGVYHLTYSHGWWQGASYSVHHATADSPRGPWAYRGPILVSDATRKGPGHHSVIRNAATGHWFIVYHRWEQQTGDGPYKGSRQIAIDRLDHGPDGTITPVVMTDAGVTPERFGPATRPAE